MKLISPTLLQVEPLMDSLVPLMLAYKEDMRVRLAIKIENLLLLQQALNLC